MNERSTRTSRCTNPVTPDTTTASRMSGVQLARLYDARFPASSRDRRDGLWQVLVRTRLQRYVDAESTVLDYGAGACGFINHVRARRKVAIDLSPRLADAAAPDVDVVIGGAEQLHSMLSSTFDVIFCSNVLEHLATREDLFELLRHFRRLLVPEGHLILIGPNYRFSYREYWDYIDHKLPLSDRSVIEALVLSGLVPSEIEPRFLPYATRGTPASPHLLRLFLALPGIVRRRFGGQFLIVARPGGLDDR
jgi:SAM-dependent methyltransferase